MPEILVVTFKENLYRASGVLDELRVLDDKWILDLEDAIALHRDHDGAVGMDQNYQPTGRRSREWGAALGLLIGASLSIPFMATGNASVAEGVLIAASLGRTGTTGVDASIWEDTLGISREFFERVSQLVLPGDSAIYAILETAGSEVASSRFQRYGGAVLTLTISIEQQQKIQRLLRDGGRSQK